MTRNVDVVLARASVALARITLLAFGLAVPLTLASEFGPAVGAGTVVVVLVAALLTALAGRSARATSGAPVGLSSCSAAPRSPLSSRIPNPIHHPLRPRAPGLV